MVAAGAVAQGEQAMPVIAVHEVPKSYWGGIPVICLTL
jgi:hypothetical protein